ncbi:MAG: hypothetical protein AAGB12_03420 [Pseudomonadota bacterium]
MFKKFLFGLVGILLASSIHANCLDSANTAFRITAKIKGFYAYPDNDYHYVILDTSDCSLMSGNVTIGANTKAHHYLKIKNGQDNFLKSVLLTSYAKGDKVSFRILAAEDGYNTVAYTIPGNL